MKTWGMHNDDLPSDPSRDEFPIVRLDIEHHSFRQAALLLEASGGERFLDTDAARYRFTSTVARDEALDRVRRRFGWTIASR